MAWLRNQYFWATLFFLGTLIVHWPSHNAGFVSDFLGWQAHYRDDSFWDFIKSYGYNGHQQVLQLINSSMYQVFGTAGIPWYILFCAAHTFNGLLLYRFLLKITQLWGTRDGLWIAVTGTAFFLFSPYHPEVTVWRVCLHYMISAACLLGSLLLTIDYLERNNRRALWCAHGLMLLNLFTLELALVIPLLTHAFCLTWWLTRPTRKNDQQPSINWSVLFRFMTLPQIGLWAFYFIFNKLTLGAWVGHYGVERHLKINYLQIFSNALKYEVKYPIFARHFAHPAKAKLFNALSEAHTVYWGYGILAALVLIAVVFRNRLTPKFPIFVMLLGMGLLAALPTAQLHFEWVQYNENDRYGYLTALFVLPALAILFSGLPGSWKYVPATGFMWLSVVLLLRTCGWWGDMERIYRKLLADFQWYDKKEIYVLSLADNYRGIWMFRMYGPQSSLVDALNLVENKHLAANVHELAFFNMNTPQDGVTVTTPDSTGMFRTEFNQWGNWWWRNGIGALDYETDQYKVQFKGKWHELTFKNGRPKDAVFIYQSGDSWKVKD